MFLQIFLLDSFIQIVMAKTKDWLVETVFATAEIREKQVAAMSIPHKGISEIEVLHDSLQKLRFDSMSNHSNPSSQICGCRSPESGPCPLSLCTQKAKEALSQSPDNVIYLQWKKESSWAHSSFLSTFFQWQMAHNATKQ